MNKALLKVDLRRRIAIKDDGTEVPVVDSKESFYLQPNQDDIKNGIPGDHANCMYCMACRRMYQSELVWIARGVAYIELKKKGRPELHRFILRAPAQDNVKIFDRNPEEVQEEAVIFAAPSKCRRLDAQHEKYERYKAKNAAKGKAYVKGKLGGSQKPRPLSETLRAPAHGKFQFYVAKS